MAGQTYSKLKPGDPCWLLVGTGNHPMGCWKGEILTVEDRGEWSKVTAKITDGRIQDHQDSDVRRYFDCEPSVNYSVVPSNKEFDWLVRRMAKFDKKMQQQTAKAAMREEALLAALERVTRRALTAEEVKEAILGD